MSRPLVGRDHELRWLRSRLLAPSEPGRVLSIFGEAGVGKSHLLSEAVGADRILSLITFPPGPSAAPGLGLHRLASCGAESAGALATELQESDNVPRGWRLFSIYEAANNILRSEPARVLVLDALQWADELTLAWLSQLEGLQGPTASVVLSLRSSTLSESVGATLDALRDNDRYESLVLEPLSVDAVAAMAQATGDGRLSRDARNLHRLTGGLPLTVREVLDELDRRDLTLEAFLEPEASEVSDPALLTKMIRRQVDGLDLDTALVVAVSCLAPQPVSEELIRGVTELGPERFDAALGLALTSGILIRTQSATTLSFRHDLYREVVQAGLPFPQKRSLHRRISAVLSDDPTYPAGPIAYQLVEAGLGVEALEWFERAAVESGRAHDHGNAMNYLRTALELCPNDHPGVRTRLCERVLVAARCSNRLKEGTGLVDAALEATQSASHRARLLLYRGRLVSYAGDFDARTETFKEALHSFSAADDKVGQATVLGELAFPLGSSLSIDERVSLGVKGLSLAEGTGDRDAIALCAVNLASASFFAGDPRAFELWAKASEIIGPQELAGDSEIAFRSFNNWALAAMAYGNHAEARRVIDASLSWCRDPYWRHSLNAANALHLWRSGRWDEALLEAEQACLPVTRPQVAAIATVVHSAIAFERTTRPDIALLASASEALIEWRDEEWGSVALACLMRIRHARREPLPDRGFMGLIELIRASGVRIGWGDVLVTAAEVDPPACRRALDLLGDQRPLGYRGEASWLWMNGLLDAADGAEDAHDQLISAASSFADLSEPYQEARALEAAAATASRTGPKTDEMLEQVANTYTALQADRSLALLLRRFPRVRSLARFRIPATQAHAGAPGLTSREREIADLARLGYTARDIGDTLGISMLTAKKHLERVKTKLGASRKSDLVRLLLDRRI